MTDKGVVGRGGIEVQGDLLCFVEVLYRFFHAGIHYPFGHAIFKDFALCIVEQLRVILSERPGVVVDVAVAKGQLLVTGHSIPLDAPCAEGLYRFLTLAGISEVSFPGTLDQGQLQAECRSLLAWRAGIGEETLHRLQASTPTPASRGIAWLLAPPDTVNDVFDAAAEVQFKRKVAGLAAMMPRDRGRRLVAEMAVFAGKGGLQLPDFPFVTGRDGAELLLTAIGAQHAVEAAKLCGYLERDASLVLSLVELLAAHSVMLSGRSPLGLLCRAWRKSIDKVDLQSRKPPKLAKKDRSGRACTTALLQRFVADNLGVVVRRQPSFRGDRRHLVSLVLQQPLYRKSQRTSNPWRRLLSTMLGTSLSPGEWLVYKGALVECLLSSSFEKFDQLFREVLTALRHSSALNSTRCLLDIWQALPSSLNERLWAYAVDELLLVDGKADRGALFQLAHLVATLPMEAMRSQLSRLEQMPSFSAKEFASRLFCPAYRSTYRFFAFLLETSLRARIAEIVSVELRRSPQDHVIAAVAPLLDCGNAAHLKFLGLYLGGGDNHPIPAPIEEAGGKVIIDSLAALDEERKEEPWVVSAIASLAELECEGAEAMLERIAWERRFGVVPSWNRSCRSAAELALGRIRRRGSM